MALKADRIALEAHRREQLLIHSYAYELLNDSLISDYKFDQDALEIDPSITTNGGGRSFIRVPDRGFGITLTSITSRT